MSMTRDGYTDAKSDFILKYTEKAKEEYADKYNPRKYIIILITLLHILHLLSIIAGAISTLSTHGGYNFNTIIETLNTLFHK